MSAMSATMAAMSATAAAAASCRVLASSASGPRSGRGTAADVAAIQQGNRVVAGTTIHCISRSSSAIAFTSRSSSLSSSLFPARVEKSQEGDHQSSCLTLDSSDSRRWVSSLFLRRQAAAVGKSGGGRRRRSSLQSVVPKAAHTQGEDGEKEEVAKEGGEREGGPQADDDLQGRVVTGKCFVVDDNIDTDQIIPAERLTLVPSKADEYEKLGSYAMEGLPARYGAYVEKGEMKTKYVVMIGGKNFGCGSSREHAPVALGAAGCKAVVAQSFARIFFRNCVATGELYPVETDDRVCDECATGDEVTVDMVNDVLVNHTTGKQYRLIPIGEAGPVIDAGGIFSYARKTGMIAQPSPA